MEKVEINALDRWGWECPKCNNWIEEEDPNYQETVCCDNCGAEYEPDVQG